MFEFILLLKQGKKPLKKYWARSLEHWEDELKSPHTKWESGYIKLNNKFLIGVRAKRCR